MIATRGVVLGEEHHPGHKAVVVTDGAVGKGQRLLALLVVRIATLVIGHTRCLVVHAILGIQVGEILRDFGGEVKVVVTIARHGQFADGLAFSRGRQGEREAAGAEDISEVEEARRMGIRRHLGSHHIVLGP